MRDFHLKTPVALIIFNRPHTTQIIFDAIRKAKPQQLFLIADGPRGNIKGEVEKCAQTRAIVEQVDWPCQVHINYSEVNLGCKKRVSSGITWLFEHVEKAIILEDDCLPNPTFFQFCEELLDKYELDHRVMMISGDNFQFGDRRSDDSYYYSQHTHIWGWATWRRAWKYYDENMSMWEDIRSGNWLIDMLQDEESAKYWYQRFEDTYFGKVDAWDYVWTFSCWINRGLTILPNVNLISNIGFGENATHTKIKTPVANIPTEPMLFPLRHPRYMIRDVKADTQTDRFVFGINSNSYNEINMAHYNKLVWLDCLLAGNRGITSTLREQGIKHVAIFGTGRVAHYLYEDLRKEGVTTLCFLDNDKNKWGKTFNNVPVYKPGWLSQNGEAIDAVVVSIEGNHDTKAIKQIHELNDQPVMVISWKDLVRKYELLTNKCM